MSIRLDEQLFQEAREKTRQTGNSAYEAVLHAVQATPSAGQTEAVKQAHGRRLRRALEAVPTEDPIGAPEADTLDAAYNQAISLTAAALNGERGVRLAVISDFAHGNVLGHPHTHSDTGGRHAHAHIHLPGEPNHGATDSHPLMPAPALQSATPEAVNPRYGTAGPTAPRSWTSTINDTTAGPGFQIPNRPSDRWPANPGYAAGPTDMTGVAHVAPADHVHTHPNGVTHSHAHTHYPNDPSHANGPNAGHPAMDTSMPPALSERSYPPSGTIRLEGGPMNLDDAYAAAIRAKAAELNAQRR